MENLSVIHERYSGATVIEMSCYKDATDEEKEMFFDFATLCGGHSKLFTGGVFTNDTNSNFMIARYRINDDGKKEVVSDITLQSGGDIGDDICCNQCGDPFKYGHFPSGIAVLDVLFYDNTNKNFLNSMVGDVVQCSRCGDYCAYVIKK